MTARLVWVFHFHAAGSIDPGEPNHLVTPHEVRMRNWRREPHSILSLLMTKEAKTNTANCFFFLFDRVFMTETNEQAHSCASENGNKNKQRKLRKTNKPKNNFQWVKYTCFLYTFYQFSDKMVLGWKVSMSCSFL